MYAVSIWFSVHGEACLPSVRQVSNHEWNAGFRLFCEVITIEAEMRRGLISGLLLMHGGEKIRFVVIM
jgi:hypothetical protein